MKKYTDQSAFTKAALHLLNQGERAQGNEDLAAFRKALVEAGVAGAEDQQHGLVCRYRIVNKKRVLRCAIGCFISKNDYTPSLEGCGVGALMANGRIPSLDNVNSALLQDLQTIHDCFLPGSWERELKKLADRYNLEVEWEWT